MKEIRKILCIIGPTASGKSTLALELAKKFNGEIVNADSRQFYRELEIGTAKPSESDRKSCDHHLIDCASIEDPWTVARFVSEADGIVQGIYARGKLPILVGGTGMYVKWFLFGLDQIPAIESDIRDRLHHELKERGVQSLHEELLTVDPESARKLPVQDTQRIMRALEVYRQTGKKIHEYWQNEDRQPRYNYVKIGLSWDRDELYGRINNRVEDMFKKGLKQEAIDLFAKYPDNPVLEKTIGYAEWPQSGFDDDEATLIKIQKNTRHFAKRQLTWFRNEEDVTWFLPSDKDGVDKFINKFL